MDLLKEYMGEGPHNGAGFDLPAEYGMKQAFTAAVNAKKDADEMEQMRMIDSLFSMANRDLVRSMIQAREYELLGKYLCGLHDEMNKY